LRSNAAVRAREDELAADAIDFDDVALRVVAGENLPR
jgi:hypothetical protein